MGVKHNGSKDYKCGKCNAMYFTPSALRNNKVNKHIEVKETFRCALCGKGFTKKAGIESNIPLHTKAKTKSEIARMQDQEIGDGPPLGIPRQQRGKESRTGYRSRRSTPSPSRST